MNYNSATPHVWPAKWYKLKNAVFYRFSMASVHDTMANFEECTSSPDTAALQTSAFFTQAYEGYFVPFHQPPSPYPNQQPDEIDFFRVKYDSSQIGSVNFNFDANKYYCVPFIKF